jgi:hypothetical protein
VKLRKQKGETKPHQKNHYCANGKIGFMEEKVGIVEHRKIYKN